MNDDDPAAVAVRLPAASPTMRLTLFDGFRLEQDGRPVDVGGRGRRLLALLAVRGALPRTVIAGTLWPDVPEERARASVRAALCGLQRTTPRLLSVTAHDVRLADQVEVDVQELLSLIRAEVGPAVGSSDEPVPPAVVELLPGGRLGGPLLPGWSDDWLLAESERLHHLRLHALDAWVSRLIRQECLPLALELAEAAVQADPLRESAQRRLMQAHLAEGNAASALRQFERFEQLLDEALQIRPSRLILTMVEEILQVSRSR